MEQQTDNNRSQADRRSIDYIQRREALKTLSQNLKPLHTVMDTHLNDLLVGHYAHTLGKHPDDFKTFINWQIAGYRIKKGEKGFAVWARPKTLNMGEDYRKTNKADRKAAPKQVLGYDEYSYYRITYLFHNGQVEKVKQGGENE
jgi:hypothetical protein